MPELMLIIQPDPDEPDGAEVYVDGTIDGRPYRFLLDTGAARTSVVSDDYTAAFASGEKHDGSGVFAAHSEDVIVLPRLTVGPIERTNVAVARGGRSLIGMDLLKDYCCHFFFGENRVALDEQACGGDAELHHLYLDPRAHPYVDVWLGVARAGAVWDTGASITVADERFVRDNPGAFEEAGRSSGTDATGATVETPLFSMAASVIGGHAFPALRVAAVDLSRVNATLERPMDLILGYNALSKADWLFDFPRRRWGITRMHSKL